jgi:hypothetical protein
MLKSDFDFHVQHKSRFTLIGFTSDVKVDILAHPYPIINEPRIEDDIKMLSLIDIAAMKVSAIFGNGTRVKDFIDIYYLLEKFSMFEIINAYETKYADPGSYHTMKSLNYFEDVITNEWPEMDDKSLNWEIVKKKNQYGNN